MTVTEPQLVDCAIEDSLIHRWLFIKDLLTCLEIPSQESPTFQFGYPQFAFNRIRSAIVPSFATFRGISAYSLSCIFFLS
jgi:hypothetical protein